MSYLFSAKNREIRFFISSTFQDMMSERETLMKRVFPELRYYCIGRQISLTEVDLRWGITTEEAMQGKVIEYCMSEIDKSRPYFLCIIGNRYGWRPSKEEIDKNAAIIERYPWVAKDIENNLSITNMEVLYGALRKIAGRNNALFYLKRWENTTTEPDEDERSLNRLRGEILDNKEFEVKTYEDMQGLQAVVFADLKALIDREFPLEDTPTKLEKERLPHIAYARMKNSFFIEKQEIQSILMSYIRDGGNPLLLMGYIGEGLSASLSHFLIKYNELFPDEYIFFHFPAIGSDHCSIFSILGRLYRELHERFALSSEIPGTEEELIEALPELLAGIGAEKCLIIIDDVDKITCEEGKSALSWLPHVFPPNIRIVFASHDREVAEECIKRDFQTYTLSSMTKEEASQYIQEYLDVYCKKLDEGLERQIIAVNWLCKPQLLRSLLDELRVFGLHEGIEEQVHYYTSCGSPEAFYLSVLFRFELDYGYRLVKKVCSLISLSKEGLKENELLELNMVSRLEFTPLLNALSLQLEQYGGNLYFHNRYIGNAVRQRYLSDQAEVVHLRRIIISFCEKAPHSVTSLRELPYQYRELGLLKKLKSYLSDTIVFSSLYQSNMYELLTYWRTLKNVYNINSVFKKAYKSTIFSCDADRVNYLMQAASFLCLNDSHAGALYFYQLLLASRGDHASTSELNSLIGTAYRKMSRYKKALQFLQDSLEDQKANCANSSLHIINTYNEIAEIYTVRGEHKKALKNNMLALDCCNRLVGEEHRLTAITCREIGWAYEFLGDYQQALSYLHKAEKIFEMIYGKNHPEIIYCYHALAWVYDWLCNYREVIKYAGNAFKLSNQYFGTKHSLTGMSYKLIALGKYRAGDYQGALEDNRSALAIFLDLYGEKHTRVSVQYFQIGLALLKLKLYEDAANYFEKSIQVDIRLIGNDNEGDFAISYNYYGESLILQGQVDKGIEIIRKALEIAKREYGLVCVDVSDSYYFIGRAYFIQEEYEKSREYLERAVTIRERVLGVDNVDTAVVYKALAATQLRLERHQEAEDNLSKAYRIFKQNDSWHLAEEE